MRSYDFEICFINISITVQIIWRAGGDSNIPAFAQAAVPVRAHVGYVILPWNIPCMRPCLHIVILINTVEVPGGVYREFGALDGVGVVGTEKDDKVIENVFIS